MVERSSHQAFGAIESDFRPDRWSAQREQYKFTGKEEDLEVGLTYFGARYYHARLNRWISPDPLTIHGLGADLNPYAYVSGRALAAVDPFGLCAECDAPDGPTKGPDGTELAEVHAHSHRASPSAAADAQTSSSGMSFAAFAETLPSVRHLEQVVRAEWANGPVAQGIAAVNLARRDGAARTAVGLLRGGFGHNGNRLGQGVNLGDLAFGPPRSDAERVGARIASHIDDLVIRIAVTVRGWKPSAGFRRPAA